MFSLALNCSNSVTFIQVVVRSNMKCAVFCSTSCKVEILMAIQIYTMTWALSPCTVLCVYQHFGGTWCFHLQGICQTTWLRIPDDRSLSANHLFTVLLGLRFEVFVVVKIWIVAVWNCDLVEERVDNFRMASVFWLQDGGGIFLWKVDNHLKLLTLS